MQESQVLGLKSLPDVLTHLLYQLPSGEAIFRDLGEVHLWERGQVSADEEVSWGKGRKVIRITGQWGDGSRVEHCLHLT